MNTKFLCFILLLPNSLMRLLLIRQISTTLDIVLAFTGTIMLGGALVVASLSNRKAELMTVAIFATTVALDMSLYTVTTPLGIIFISNFLAVSLSSLAATILAIRIRQEREKPEVTPQRRITA